ncbi:MAG: hypothetical protein V1858_00370 [Candidatus Gottesmanbacteria bacterium]
MQFFKRLGGKKLNSGNPNEPKIRFDWQTWVAPIIVGLSNIFLILPLLKGTSGFLDFIIIASYITGPVLFYFYMWEVTNRRLTSLIAALIYTIPQYRLSSIVLYDDVSHIVFLGFTPLMLILFLRFFKNMTLNLAIVCSIGLALGALISPFGFFTLLILLGIETYSEMLLGQGRVKFFCVFLILILTAGLSAFWYHPLSIFNIIASDRGRSLISLIWSLIPISFFIVPVTGAFSFLIFDRKPHLQPFFLAASSSTTFLLLTFVGDHLSANLLPVPSRFLPELVFALAFLLSIIIVGLLTILRSEIVARIFRLSLKVSVALYSGLIGFILSFLLALIFFLRPSYWILAQGQTKPLVSKAIIVTDGISQIIGIGITLLTIILLIIIKIKTRTSNNVA